MPSYKAPLEDVRFLLTDVFQIDRYNNLPGFSDASPDVREAILTEAAKLSEEILQPLNRVGDLEGCTRHDDGRVTTPRSEEHTSELQSLAYLVFRLLLEKKTIVPPPVDQGSLSLACRAAPQPLSPP